MFHSPIAKISQKNRGKLSSCKYRPEHYKDSNKTEDHLSLGYESESLFCVGVASMDQHWISLLLHRDCKEQSRRP